MQSMEVHSMTIGPLSYYCLNCDLVVSPLEVKSDLHSGHVFCRKKDFKKWRKKECIRRKMQRR